MLEMLAFWKFCEPLNYTLVVSPGSKKYSSSPNKNETLEFITSDFYISLVLFDDYVNFY